MRKETLISLFTGQTYIVAIGFDGLYYYSLKTEGRDWVQIDKSIYDDSFESALVSAIINLN